MWSISNILISLGVSLVLVYLGFFISFLLFLPIGIPLEKILESVLTESSLKRFRHSAQFIFYGLTVGIGQAFLTYLWGLNQWVGVIIFILYIIILMKHKTDFVFIELCGGDILRFKGYARKIEVSTFIGYLCGLYGVWMVIV